MTALWLNFHSKTLKNDQTKIVKPRILSGNIWRLTMISQNDTNNQHFHDIYELSSENRNLHVSKDNSRQFLSKMFYQLE